MGRCITIQLEVYVPFRGRRHWSGAVSVPAGLPAGDLPEVLGLAEPELAVLVGGRSVDPATPLGEGDAVVIIPRAEGGTI